MALDADTIRLILDTTESQSATHKLAEEVARLSAKLEELKDDFRQGDWTEQHYIETSDRLTASLKEKSRILEEVADVPETGTGFGGLSKNVFKAERAFDMLSHPGGGLARAGPMLESVTTAMGMTSGVGFVVVGLMMAVEKIIPRLKEMFDKFEGGTDTVKQAADELERAVKAAEKLEATPTMAAKTTASRVTSAITERGTEAIESQVELAMTKEGPLEAYISDQDKSDWEREKHELDPGEAKKVWAKILERARIARKEQARTLVGTAPGERGSRDRIRQLAAAAPGVMGKGFLTELDLAEPEAQVERKQIIQAEEGAGKEMKSWGDKRKAEIKAEKERVAYNKEVEKEENDIWKEAQATKKHDDAEKKRLNIIAANMKQQENHEAEAAQRKADRAAEKFAREHTPVALNHAALQQQENADLGMMQQYAPNLGPELQKSAAKHARENHQAGKDLSATFQQALDYAIEQARQDFARGIEAGMRHSMGHQATQYGRG